MRRTPCTRIRRRAPRTVSAILLFVTGAALPHLAASQAPHLAGEVMADPTLGLLDAAVCVSRLVPSRGVRFLLSAPLNIKHVTDGRGEPVSYREVADPRWVGEAREYVASVPDEQAPITTLCVSYRGAVPVFDSNTAQDDWKGRIVATHGTLRAAEQTRWYPTPYDSAAVEITDVMTYGLLVTCPSCKAIYVNGAPVVQGASGRFESSTPRQVLLYAGDFAVRRTPSFTFLGGTADSITIATFDDTFRRIADYYAAFLGVPYGEHPVLLSFTAVARRYRPGAVQWQFVTWPTITFSGGIDFDQLIDRAGTEPRLPDWLWRSMSHEMGHYYFGTLRAPHGPLYWPVLESTAEYLSLKSALRFRGEAALYPTVLNYLFTLAAGPYPPLDVDPDSLPSNSAYRYRVVPLYLLELDHLAGEAKVAQMLRTLVQAPDSEVADFAQWRRAARSAGIPDTLLALAMTPSRIRDDFLGRAHHALDRAVDATAPNGDDVIAIAVGLINTDTTAAGLHEISVTLQRFVTRDTTALGAYYQIGKVGAVSGNDLDAAERALERYLRAAEPSGGPSHGAAEWRLGMIAEHRGDVARARELYQRAMRDDPALAQAKEAFARLDAGK